MRLDDRDNLLQELLLPGLPVLIQLGGIFNEDLPYGGAALMNPLVRYSVVRAPPQMVEACPDDANGAGRSRIAATQRQPWPRRSVRLGL